MADGGLIVLINTLIWTLAGAIAGGLIWQAVARWMRG